jgi:hypothetical protein
MQPKISKQASGQASRQDIQQQFNRDWAIEVKAAVVDMRHEYSKGNTSNARDTLHYLKRTLPDSTNFPKQYRPYEILGLLLVFSNTEIEAESVI